MLFAVKRRAAPAIALAAILLAAAIWLRGAFDLAWPLAIGWDDLLPMLMGGAILAASDGSLYLLMVLAFRDGYRTRYRGLADYFEGQGPVAILAGGILAAAEEFVFRGLILESARQRAGLGWPAAIGISAVAFGLCHLIPKRKLWTFAIWATWEGALLGGVYWLTGSLAATAILHLIHDIAGLSFFAWQRKTGRYL